jgi:hypothetical protein
MQDALPTRAHARSQAAAPTSQQAEAAALDRAVSALAEDQDPTAIDAPTCTQLVQNQHVEKLMPTLTDEMKTFIVMGLARFETPSKVARAVNSTFGVELTRSHVKYYDPGSAKPPAPRWRELHATTRAAFLADMAKIGVSHKVVRLKLLDEITNYAHDNRYRDDVAAYLEQAAKEVGGIYERKTPPRD